MDGYRVWKQQLRETYLKSTGNEHLADHLWALDVIDTDLHKPQGFTKTAIAEHSGGVAKDRKDVIEVKNRCREARAALGTLEMSDVVRCWIERSFDAVEELSEVGE